MHSGEPPRVQELAASLVLILLFPESVVALWAGAILLGLFIASIFPTIFTLAERRMTLTGTITSWFFVGASTGAMFFPWLMGQLFEAIAQFIPQLNEAVPSRVPLLAAGRPVNPYEFLFLMAQALRQIESGQPFENVLLMWAFEIPRQAGMLAMTHGFYTKEARLMPEKKWLSFLQLWTFKPARLNPEYREAHGLR